MNKQEKKLIADALESLARTISWTVPKSSSAARDHLLEAWAAIDKFKICCEREDE